MNNTNLESGNSKKSTSKSTFQLPTLPPWKTPQYRKSKECGNSTLSTPLHRPDRKGKKQKDQLGIEKVRPSPIIIASDAPSDDDVPTDMNDPDEQMAIDHDDDSREPTEYDFRPFTAKNQLQETKKNNILRSERASHCLIFHKPMHDFNIEKFRPDLHINCEEQDNDHSPFTQTNFLADTSVTNNSSLLEFVPGYTKAELKKGSIKKLSLERPNVRRIEEILNHENDALKRFWSNSQIADTLERNHLHEQFLILKQEQEELKKIKEQMLKNVNKTHDFWLRKTKIDK